MKYINSFITRHILPALLTLLLKTLKIKLHNSEAENTNSVFIFWHSKMLIGWWLFKDNNSSALVSKSSDGEILNNVLTKWGYNVFRGSSSKGGKEAIEALSDFSKRNKSNIVITPDGPGGPKEEIKNGALIISNRSGKPVIPVKIIIRNKKILTGSWDQFEIPMPFTVCDVYFGRKYFYKEYLPEQQLTDLKKEISSQM